jgi:hypothetical protein
VVIAKLQTVELHVADAPNALRLQSTMQAAYINTLSCMRPSARWRRCEQSAGCWRTVKYQACEAARHTTRIGACCLLGGHLSASCSFQSTRAPQPGRIPSHTDVRG